MNVYQRPLFRQAGGPVAPQMAQPAMQPSQDQVAMLQAAEQMAAQETEGLGAQYAQNTLASLDAAETPEDVINAIRGNQMPLEARYEELAQYVGEEDAGQTPQSVLALVQPTLMMTEEGAMNSGIGDLMRNITGEIDMITEEGVPTDMGQGVGSLMMAGVGQQPVANFSQGGAVQHFQTGGEASRLQQLYSEMLPVYQGIMGDGEEARRMSQAQILFDIADRAGAFAAGIDPRTGQSVAGLSPAAQLAAATTGLGGQIGQRMAGLEEQDRALKLAALQAAQGEYSAERAAARAASGRERGIGERFEVIGPDGQVITTVRLRTQDDFDRVQAEYPDALIREYVAPDTSFDTVTLYNRITGEPTSFLTTDAESRAQATAALRSGDFVAERPPETGEDVVLINPNDLTDSVPVQVGTPEYSQALRMGYRTLSDAQTLRNLTAPGGIGDEYQAVDQNGQVVGQAFLSTTADLDRFQAEYPNATIRKAQEAELPITYVNPDNVNERIRAVPGSPEAIAAEARNFVPVEDAATIAGMQPESGAIGKQYEAVNAQGEVVASEFLADRAQLEAFQAANPGATIREALPPQDTTGATLQERQLAEIINPEILDNLENLSQSDLDLFAGNVSGYIRETVGPQGVTTSLPIPPGTQSAMRRAYEAGVDFPGIDPTSFGAPPRPDQFDATAAAIIDPSVDLTAATGLLSSVARGINFLSEQAAEIIGGEGTVFSDTRAGSAALNSLAQATSRFYIEGRTLAREFENLQQELVRPSGFRTDADARTYLEQQRALLAQNRERVADLVSNPANYTNADASKGRQTLRFLDQLINAYDMAIENYQRGARGGALDPERRDRILNDPAFTLQPQE